MSNDDWPIETDVCDGHREELHDLIECERCEGTGKANVIECRYRGPSYMCCGSCEHEVECEPCDGTGKVGQEIEDE